MRRPTPQDERRHGRTPPQPACSTRPPRGGPDHPAVEDEQGRTFTYADAGARAPTAWPPAWRAGASAGATASACSCPRGSEAVAAIHGILRVGRGLCAGRSDRAGRAGRGDPRRRRGQGRGRRGRAWPSGSAQAWPGPGPLPRLIVVGDDRRGARPRADAAWDEVLADDGPLPLPPRRDPRRPGLHPLHVGLDRPAQGGDALARQRLHVPRLVPPDARPLRADDRFASHAPFHFDLSVFDLFASCRQRGDAGPDRRGAGQGPGAARRRSWPSAGSSVWYSAPSILALLTQYGGLDRPGCAAPRLVLFAGEVFPIAPLRRLRAALARGRRSGTSTGRPRPTSAPRTRSPRRSPTTAPSPSRSARSARRSRARVVDERGRDVPPGRSASW